VLRQQRHAPLAASELALICTHIVAVVDGRPHVRLAGRDSVFTRKLARVVLQDAVNTESLRRIGECVRQDDSPAFVEDDGGSNSTERSGGRLVGGTGHKRVVGLAPVKMPIFVDIDGCK